jgi:hypothetical protein
VDDVADMLARQPGRGSELGDRESARLEVELGQDLAWRTRPARPSDNRGSRRRRCSVLPTGRLPGNCRCR